VDSPAEVQRAVSEMAGTLGGEGAGPMNKQPKTAPNPIGASFLTIREAAEVLRLSERTVRKYVKSGEIRGKLIGNRWRFRRADLDAFFENAPSNWDFAGRRTAEG
jgi:excisionase family DNA binding protein